MEDRMLSDEILLALIKKAGGGINNYEDLENKPQIGGVELSGNKSLADLDNLPDPDVLADDIIENLQSALESFQELKKQLD